MWQEHYFFIYCNLCDANLDRPGQISAGLQGREYKFRQNQILKQALVQDFQQVPDVGRTYGFTGALLWPVEEVRPEGLLGDSLEALDPIRFEYRCHIVFDYQDSKSAPQSSRHTETLSFLPTNTCPSTWVSRKALEQFDMEMGQAIQASTTSGVGIVVVRWLVSARGHFACDKIPSRIPTQSRDISAVQILQSTWTLDNGFQRLTHKDLQGYLHNPETPQQFRMRSVGNAYGPSRSAVRHEWPI